MTSEDWLALTDPNRAIYAVPVKHFVEPRWLVWAIACAERAGPLVRASLSGALSQLQACDLARNRTETVNALARVCGALAREAPRRSTPYTVTSQSDDVYFRWLISEIATLARIAKAASSRGAAQSDKSRRYKERRRQCAMIHDIIGDPFRPVKVTFAKGDPRVEQARQVARGIVLERRFDELPILADALEDAGCDNEELLRHCRGVGSHFRGCWAVAVLLDPESRRSNASH